MKITWMALSALPLLAAPLPGAQDPGGESGHSQLKRVAIPEAREERESREDFDREEWRKKLTQSDLPAREEAFEKLVAIGRRNARAREAIEAWAREDGDPGLAWTCRLLGREIGRRPRGIARLLGPDGGSGGSWLDFDADDFRGRFEDLDGLFLDLRGQFDDLVRLAPGHGSGGSSSFESLNLQVGSDGVKCEVTEKVDGREETRKYEAKSIEELLDAHPELRDRIGARSGLRARLGPLKLESLQGLRPRILEWRGLGVEPRGPEDASRDRPDAARDPEDAPRAGEVRTDRLGIQCSPTTEDKASELGLESGQGLLVHETIDGSLARMLAIRPGDVVLEVNGRKVHAAADVKEVLAGRKEGEAVTVTVADLKGRRTLRFEPRPGKKPRAEKSEARDL